MKKVKMFTAMLLAVLMMFTLVACGSGSQGDEIFFGLPSDIETMDPRMQNDTYSEEVMKMVYGTLFTFDENTQPTPYLAEDYSVSDDHLTWTFHLKKGVKFHNGDELTAEDVVATFTSAMPSDAGFIVTAMIGAFESVTAVDDYTVEITTKDPYGPMLSLLCNSNTSILNAEYIEQYGRDLGTSAESVNGCGPFKFVSWSREEEVVIEKNPDFFGEIPQISSIHYMVMPEDSSRVIALENGEVDIIYKVPSDDVARLDGMDNISVLKAAGVGQRLFRFGCNDPIISNTKVRQALTHAIDREAIASALFAETSYETTGPLAPVIFGSYDFGPIKQDLEKAKALLAEAGYPNGFDTKIVTTSHYDKGIELAEMISAQLKEINVNAEIEVLEWSVYLPMWGGRTADEFDLPIFIMGAGTSMADADGGFYGLYTTSPDGKNDRNYGLYSNEEVDRLVEAGRRETDLEKRQEYYRQAGQILYLDDPAAMWIYDQYVTAAYNDKIQGLRIDALGCLLFTDAVIQK